MSVSFFKFAKKNLAAIILAALVFGIIVPFYLVCAAPFGGRSYYTSTSGAPGRQILQSLGGFSGLNFGGPVGALVGAMYEAGGGAITYDDLNDLVNKIVRPFFESFGTNKEFLDALIQDIAKRDPIFAANLKTYTDNNTEFQQSYYSSSIKDYLNSDAGKKDKEILQQNLTSAQQREEEQQVMGEGGTAGSDCLTGMWTDAFGVSLEADSSPSNPNYNKIMSRYWLRDENGNILRDKNGNPIVDVGKYSEDVGLTEAEIMEKYGTKNSDTSGSGSESGSGVGSGGGTTTKSKACTSYTYSDWSACVGGSQTRSIISRSPSDCTDTSSRFFTQSCTMPQAPVVVSTTNATQTKADPVLSVTTDRPSFCQYKKDSSFTYGSGTMFDTTSTADTNVYSHNTTLFNLASGNYAYYVVCKDKTTNGTSTAIKIEFKVDLSQDSSNAPVIVNITPVTQTNASPNLTVTTDRPATCQYKESSSFTYGSGSAMTTPDNYSHSVSISSLADGNHTFYVVCQDSRTNAISSAKQVTTMLNRGTADATAPVITNTTNGYQTVDNPNLTITTNKSATCQYKEGSSFYYGSGTQFTVDGGTSHSAALSNLADGQHYFYVICRDPVSGVTSAADYQIIFTVNADGANICANLTSNDRKNDGNRSNSSTTNADSSYIWQAVEKGTRDRFSKVDWYAGYQFTPEIDGQINQLCGYFDIGVNNKVSVYNGSYVELASAQIVGNGSWRCVDISPLAITADNRYYVIARIENNSIYFEYKSGMLPRRSGSVIIEAGIRQLANDNALKTDIVKYDYMILGLVDARVSYGGQITSGPEIISTSPVGTVNGSMAVLWLQTNTDATCKFDRDDVSYSQMSYNLPKVSTNNFSQKICGLESGAYTFYVRCRSVSGVENNASKLIQFNVSQ